MSRQQSGLIQIDFNKHATEGFNKLMYKMIAVIPKHVPDVVLESFYRQGFLDALNMLQNYDKGLYRGTADITIDISTDPSN